MTSRLLCALLSACALACSPASVGPTDAGGGSGDGASGPSADKACADYAYARCARYQACSPIAVEQRYGDIPTCQGAFAATCTAGMTAPSTGQTPANQETCAQAIPSWDCADYLFGANPPPECKQPTGTIATGAACAFPSQCQTAFCAIVPGAACGVCAAVPVTGDSCAQLTTCGNGTGLGCDGDTQTCLAAAPSATTCAPGQPCVLGSQCVGVNAITGASGTCNVAAEAVGAACSSTTNECDFYAGLTCNNLTKQCGGSQFGGAGAPCNYIPSQSVSMFCAGGAKCIAPTPGAQGTCAAISPLGGPCDLVAGPDCQSPERCVAADGGTGGTCAIPDGTACP